MSCSMTRRSDAGEARNCGPLVSSSQCLNTKCGQSKLFGTGPLGRVRVQTFWPNTNVGLRSCRIFKRKYGHIHGIQKSLAIQMPKLRKRDIHNTFFFLKKRGGLNLAALKKGGIRANIRIMSYIGSYPPRMS